MPISFTAAEAVLALCAATLAGIVLLLFFRVRENSLEDVFIQLTGRRLRE